VRVTPHELHVSDPYFYTEIYAGPTRKREKDPRMVRLAGQPTSMFATVDHNLHASRRAILSSFFSKKSITGLETMIQGKVEKLMGRLATACDQGTVVPLDSASSALTADIISEFAYGVSLDYLDDPNFKNEVAESILSLASSVHVLKFFPFILSLSKIIPDSVVETLSPEASKILRLQKLVRAQAAVALKNGGHVKGKDTMFGALCDPSLPAEERTLDRLQDEGFSLIGGGTETTTGTLKIIMFNLLHNKSLLSKLREELAQNSCDTWAELEQLPYMVSYSV
jgi:cytochrome P450